jgi:cytochrome c oxidase subunit 4
MSEHVHGRVGHIVPLWILLAVGAALTVLTILTVSVTEFDLGYNGNLFVAMFIATVKGSLVVLYFMHLRWDRPFNALVFVSALAFMALFLALAMMDSDQYQDQLVPGYAPEIQRTQ